MVNRKDASSQNIQIEYQGNRFKIFYKILLESQSVQSKQ